MATLPFMFPRNWKIFLLLALALLWACQTLFATMPAEAPADATINLYSGGGMRPEGHSITLSRQICVIDERRTEDRLYVWYPADAKKFAETWQLLKRNKYRSIGMREENVHDRGGISMQVSYADTTINKNNSGMHYVTALWRTEWNNIVEHIETEYARELARAGRKKVSFQTDITEEFSISVIAGRRTILYSQFKNGKIGDYVPFQVEAAPGDYQLKIQIYGKTVKHREKELKFRLSPNHSGLEFHINNADMSVQVR